MFLDYSGSHAFQSINKVFGENYLFFVQYTNESKFSGKFKIFKRFARLLPQIDELQKEDFFPENNVILLNQIFIRLLTLDQLNKVGNLISKCPTVYFVFIQERKAKKLIANEKMVLESPTLLDKSYWDLKQIYEDTIRYYYKNITNRIILHKPDTADPKVWNNSQKLLFRNSIKEFLNKSKEEPLFKIPITLPKAFTKNGQLGYNPSGNFKVSLQAFIIAKNLQDIMDMQEKDIILVKTRIPLKTVWRKNQTSRQFTSNINDGLTNRDPNLIKVEPLKINKGHTFLTKHNFENVEIENNEHITVTRTSKRFGREKDEQDHEKLLYRVIKSAASSPVFEDSRVYNIKKDKEKHKKMKKKSSEGSSQRNKGMEV
ncbi:uncharacterized protein NDAI_0A03350 [Naumovozyma dairenensis CBS 421]|uniref:Uncharacterized protein n=1 Tax=Naumovozyma dairenensis (strain ATCC 10597 / BCRC 20456 / CBS 421 / NBRC 0211 / NRRL Y-12639) TaxID=1071378 RepID=G0W3V4_NAUDC|nr:hypothetical protein NDAI_0A03350 [Naumovozyma dairenensis CBS 421]CCD22492.1 hypothetical protein NDAI_0A03350 [Naumovozyma dairenensis CBS 421]